MSETTTNPIEALQQLIRSQLLDVNTALPGTVVSYTNGLARVQPNPKKQFADGDVLDYPIIPNVRVCWPSFNGGKAGIKGPVKAGDQCLLIFSQQGVDNSDDRRMFDLQDAYAIMVDVGRAGSGDSGDNAHMTMFHGPAYIRITESGAMEVNAPGGIVVKAPLTTFKGKVTVEQLLTYMAGLIGSGSSGGASASITGDIVHTGGTITSLGKSIDGTHAHGGVQPGGGNTGAPV
jgi:hypothetical protein